MTITSRPYDKSGEDTWDRVFNKKCDHDYSNPIRKGKLHYVCSKCEEDISLAVVLIEEAKNRENSDRWWEFAKGRDFLTWMKDTYNKGE